jgi:hypothetical protein
MKYRIPSNTVVAAGGFVVFNESQFNTGPNAFAFSSKGDSVYLFSGNGTNITGYVHGFDFGAQANGVTFGRYIISTGNDHFVTQIANTLGSPNAGPLVGPVVISEIMYHPPDVQVGANYYNNPDDEYIELENFSANAVPLYDPANPANTWHLRDAVDFDFPSNTTIAAHSFILITSLDPANAGAIAAFRARNGVADAVPIFGPFQGELNNAGEAVELRRPDVPQPPGASDAGFVPYILVERVNYSDSAPWPIGADGIGPSLQRVSVTAYGNDPANWVAGAKTPGAAYVGGAAPVINSQPADTTVVASGNASFSVTAGGVGPFSYQWRFNGKPIPGATSATLTLNNVQPSQAGQYSVVVLTAANSIASRDATLTVQIPPSIVSQPQSQSVFPATTVSFSIVAVGTSPITYQWRYNGADIPGATQAMLILNNVQPSQAGIYEVLVANPVTFLPPSSPAVLNVYTNPIIVVQPKTFSGPPGTNASFSISAISSTPIRYQWSFNGTPLAGATNSTLTVTNIQLPNAGNYQVLLTDSYGFVYSDAAALNVLIKPVITQQPVSQIVALGSSASFTCSATGSPPPLSFRWRRNNQTLPFGFFITNGTTSIFTTNNVTTNGFYNVAITNLAGAALGLSSNGYLYVMAPPTDQTVAPGADATFSIVPQGIVPQIQYQWQFNGGNVADATNSTLTLTNAQPSATGNYSVSVTITTNVPVPTAIFTAHLQVGPPGPALSNPRVNANGSFSGVLLGQVSRTYALEISTNLSNWAVWTNITATSASTPFVDVTATNAPQRFYRARLLP